MIIQASTPRIVFHPDRHPKHIVIETLAKPGVSSGQVFFNMTMDAEFGVRDTAALTPTNVYPIPGLDGFEGHEYLLPFYKIFDDRKRNLGLARICASGFNVTIESAFRLDTMTYAERLSTLTVLTPVTGGGVLRVGESLIDIANPTFDPYERPSSFPKNLDLHDALRRTHQLMDASVEARRRSRIVAAEASMDVPERALPSTKSTGLLPSKAPSALPPHDPLTIDVPPEDCE